MLLRRGYIVSVNNGRCRFAAMGPFAPKQKQASDDDPYAFASVKKESKKPDETPEVDTKKKAKYLSGFEDHPYYSDAAKVKANEARGFRKIDDAAHKQRNATHDANNMQSSQRPDARHSRPVDDYRELQDPDPYASIFKEKKSFGRLRLQEWRKQFERENEGVELPYERTNPLFRAVPNWWVRMFVRIRSKGFIDPFYLHVGAGMCVCLCVIWINVSSVHPREARDHSLLG